MDQELAMKLFNDFPDLYRGCNKPMTEPLMCFGFECGDGWFQIIYDLSSDLMRISRTKGYKPPVVVQVKEKFGGLRFYIDGCNEEFYNRIKKAEELSVITCEICGRKGKLRRGGWIQTLCDKHANELK